MRIVTDSPRACTKEELPLMIAMADGVMRQGSDQSLLSDYPLVYKESNLENIRILKVGDEIASVVPYIPKRIEIEGCHFNIGIISPTATALEHRKKGYALKCVNSCIDKMMAEGIDLSVLWTLEPTFKFYENANFQGIRSQGWIYNCSNKDAVLFRDNGHDIVKYNPQTQQYIADIQSMHENECYGVFRSVEEYPVLFSLPKMTTLLAIESGRTVAYLVLSNATNKPGILEAGGNADGVESLFRHVLCHLKNDGVINAYDNLTPTVLGELLYSRMPERRNPLTAGPMMVRMNNIRKFFEKIKKWLEIRNQNIDRRFSIIVKDTGEVISLEFIQGELELSTKRLNTCMELTRRELTSIVFGTHPARLVNIPEIIRYLFPFYFPIWMLDHS